jgi:hypothetical protein
VLEGARLQRGQHLVDICDQKVGSAGELHVETGIEHVRGGHALVDEARLGADDFGQMGQEGDNVMLGFALDLVDPGDVEGDVTRLGPDRLRGFLRDDAKFRLRISRMRLDLEPDLEAGLRLPDGSHFRAGVAGDHRRLRRIVFTPRFSRSVAGKPPVKGLAGWKTGGRGRPGYRLVSPHSTARRTSCASVRMPVFVFMR